jgi:protein SCO1
MNSRNLMMAITGLTAGALLAFIALSGSLTRMVPAGTTVQTGKALIGGPFTLTDHNGKRVTEKDFLGKPMLIFFGFTHCPDICPSALQVVSAALDKLGAKGAGVTPVFITLDSERDTPEKLADYVKSFHPRLVGLTGSAAEIDAVAKSYHVFYQKVADDKSPASYTFDHAAILYLMGANGAFVTHIPHATNVDEVAAILNKALS